VVSLGVLLRFWLTYLQARADGFSLILDGWTAPFGPSYLGVVISWVENGDIHDAVLEFIKLVAYVQLSVVRANEGISFRLNSSHTGEYLASNINKLLCRFGLAKLVCHMPSHLVRILKT
jgi:hypothetical protein